jgi:hypothetical protein
MLHNLLSQMLKNRPREQRSQVREEFESLETKWIPPERTGFEPAGDGESATG